MRAGGVRFGDATDGVCVMQGRMKKFYSSTVHPPQSTPLLLSRFRSYARSSTPLSDDSGPGTPLSGECSAMGLRLVC